jgi:hypothetical protein
MNQAARATRRTGGGITLGAVYRRLFTDRAERSRLLRFLALATGAWAAGTLAYVSGSVWPLFAIPALLVAHLVSYLSLNRRLPVLSVFIAIVIVASGVTMRFDLVESVRGDRAPVALFLLISTSAAAFDARTRASLYTQLIFASLVMFFAAETAFGNEFGAFLAVYMVLLLAFMASAHLADTRNDAAVARFGSKAGAPAYWSSAGIALLASAGVAFLLLPWDTSQTPQAAQSAILPFNGQEGGVEPAVKPSEARAVIARGQSSGTGAMLGGPADNGSGQGIGPDGEVPIYQQGTEGPELIAAGSGTVAYVRSPVASYWRGGALDTYVPGEDGTGKWVSTFNQQHRLIPAYSDDSASASAGRYGQTYFLQQPLENPITGYSPVAWALPFGVDPGDALDAGATYQVISDQPEYSVEELREDSGSWLREEYAALPRGSGDLRTLTAAIIEGAETDFDRAAAIAAYLHTLSYDPASDSPLTPSAPLDKFLTGEAPGSAIDFATASALMARAAGLQSRVVAGYLPGSYNPYSGASTVTSADAHAWAEVWFREAGWVPFDASSRPDLPQPPAEASPPPQGFGFLLEHRVGDSIASAAANAPGGLRSLIKAMIEYWQQAVALLVAAASLAAAVFLFLRRRGRVRRTDKRYAYSAITGPGRREVLAAFARVERTLHARGFRRRSASESFGAYAAAAGRSGLSEAAGIEWLARAASEAAYSSRQLGASKGDEARRRARDLEGRLSKSPPLARAA